MAMEMKLNLKMAQKLVMTPMLQQAIKLLPLARLELAQHIQQELVDNPILEELVEEDTTEADSESTEDDFLDSLGETTRESEEENGQNPVDQDIDWESYIQDNLDRGMSAESYTERPSIESTYKRDPSLFDHLHWQLDLTVDSDQDKFIGSNVLAALKA